MGQRFEFVEDKSSKFWEIDLVGSELHIAWGRIGTNGQSQVKSFPDDAKAMAAREKLISEKTKKGYVEVGASPGPTPKAETPKAETPKAQTPKAQTPKTPTSAEAPRPPVGDAAPSAPVSPVASPSADRAPLPDEDTLVLPSGWSRRLHPRRGYPSGAGTTRPNPSKAFDKLVKQYAPVRKTIMGARERDGAQTELMDRVDAKLGATDLPTPHDPVLEAAAATIAGYRGSWDAKASPEVIVDYWVGTAGLAFATDAALSTMAFRMGAGYLARADDPTATRSHYQTDNTSLLMRLRRFLAEADDADYAAARAVAQRHRATHDADVILRVATSYLFPTEREWVDADIEARVASGNTHHSDHRRHLLNASTTHLAQLERLGVLRHAWGIVGSSWMVDTFSSIVEGLGAEATDACVRWLDLGTAEADAKRRLLEGLSVIPTDDAMLALIERMDQQYALPALTEATDRFPRRAIRLLAACVASRAKNHEAARSLLGSVTRRWPHALDAVRGELPEGALETIRALGEEHAAKPEAPAERLPKILASPPWSSGREAVKPRVLRSLAPLPRPAEMAWPKGLREEWKIHRGALSHVEKWTRAQWEQMHANLRAGKLRDFEVDVLLVSGPEDIARAALQDWLPREAYYVSRTMRPIVARHELAALRPLVYFASHSLRDALPFFLPYDAPALASSAADAFTRLKSARADAEAWLLSHPEAAAVGLVPDAVGKLGRGRHAAETALRFLARSGHEDTVRTVAGRYGVDAASVIDEGLSTDPLDVIPAKMPKMPSFWDAGGLPPPLLRDRSHQLPTSAIEHLGTMLALSVIGDEHLGLEPVKEACDPASLARFAWSLFEAWQSAGMPAKEGWAFGALAFFGDDETARQLTPIIRKWPGEGGHARAVTGLDVLAAIGTDVALMHLHGIAQRVKFKGLQDRASGKIQEIARARDLTPEELADRLVPDLGLDDDGSMVLDYGERRFTVGFDQELKPFVLDEEKQPLKALPKPAKKDDEEKATDAYKAFGALKKDARTVAKDQLARMELAMCGQRRWSGEQLVRFFVEHPLLIHLARRLVWATFDAKGELAATFRVAEDRSFADASDDAWDLPADATVGIPHMLELGDALATTWGDVFADYEILQPFTQLGREVYAPTDEERQATHISRVKGTVVPTGKVLGLEARGWRRGQPQDGGVVWWIEKRLAGGEHAYLYLEPGIFTGYMEGAPEQTLEEVYVSSTEDGAWNRKGNVRVEALDPVVYSELVRDLAQITS